MDLTQTLRQHVAASRAALPKALKPDHHLNPEAAVLAVAALDGAYHALLEHSLTCGWSTPVVPPPHVWFPAMTAAHAGIALLSCLKSLIVPLLYTSAQRKVFHAIKGIDLTQTNIVCLASAC